jgi:hypothetical protein
MSQKGTSTHMITSRKKLVRIAAALAAIGAACGASMVAGSPANADPKQYSALSGYGSDTTQDVMNALSGFVNGRNFTPVQTSAGTGQIQLVSWDAFPANECIVTKVGAPTILRPNGSTNGRRILSRAFGGGTWPTGTGNPCGHRNASGLVDFARSSAGPSGAGSALTYIPFGRDALTWAYNKPSGSPVVNLTPAQLQSLHLTGPQNIGGTVIIPCGIQTGSGTYQSWMTAIGISVSPLGQDVGTNFCNTALAVGGLPDPGGRLQESNGPELTIKANALATTSDPICDGVAGGAAVSCANAQVIVGFSASQFIARSNNVAAPNPGPGVALGQINGTDPVNGVAPNLTADPVFYANTTFGRDVYNVVASEVLQAPADARIVEMFVGPSSAVCSASATIQQFGFLALGTNCGSTTLTGPFVA